MCLHLFTLGALLFVWTTGGLSGTAAAGGYFGSMVSKPAQKVPSPTSSKKDYALYFFLGQRHLEAGNRRAAIEAWTRYVALAPQDARSLAVRERLTLLKLAEAKEFVRRRLRNSEPMHPGGVPVKSVAVFNFRNQGPSELGVLTKGLTAMIITDLSKVPGLRVLEREKVAALLREIRLGQTGVVDQESAPRMGRILAARYVVWGKMGQPGKDRLRLDSEVGESETSTESARAGVEGPLGAFFKLEKQLVEGLLKSLGVREEDLGPDVLAAVRKIHTKSIAALAYYSAGLDYLDQERFPEAKEAFRKATEADPAFDLAREAYISTPSAHGEKEDSDGEGIMLTGGPRDEWPEVVQVEKDPGVVSAGEGTGPSRPSDGEPAPPRTQGQLDQGVDIRANRSLTISPPVSQGTSGVSQGQDEAPPARNLTQGRIW